MKDPIYFSGPPGQEFLPTPADRYVPLSSMNPQTKLQVFGLWLGIVFVNREPQPSILRGLPEGMTVMDDPITVMDFHNDYEAGAWRRLNRGLTLEETWLTNELQLGRRNVCVINSNAPLQPTDRVTRKVTLDAASSVAMAFEYFRVKTGLRRHPIVTLVTDHVFGHCINLVDAAPAQTHIAFLDPWPGRSLLCEENNSAGVKATPLGSSRLHFPNGATGTDELWQITRDDLARVLVALLIPVEEWSALGRGDPGPANPQGGRQTKPTKRRAQ